MSFSTITLFLDTQLVIFDLLPQVAIQLDGPGQFFSNPPHLPLGDTLLEWRLLLSTGFKVTLTGTDRLAIAIKSSSCCQPRTHILKATVSLTGGVGAILCVASGR